MASGPSVLQRLAGLNRSGRLVKPLQYTQVKSFIAEVGEKTVLEILDRLEEQAEDVGDPTEFLRSAVASVGGSAPAAAATAGSSGRKPAASSALIARRLQSLNKSERLNKPVNCGRVEAALGSLGMARAMTILQGVEDAAEDIADPTAYIRTAVRSAGGAVSDDEAEEPEDVQEEALEDAAEEEDIEVEIEEEEQTPSKRVKQEPKSDQKGGKGKGKSKGKGKDKKGKGSWVVKKEEDLTEAERIERRVQWINRNRSFSSEIDPKSVLPALETLGFRQSMRVLRRLEEATDVSDPNEFIRDLVGRSGWVWANPETIDEDTKVAKRVAWLNQFGCLRKPINWPEVADLLDSLKVAHAMVLLRELEMQGNKVADPTAYIKHAAEQAGADEILLPPADTADTVIMKRISELNSGGELAAPIDSSALVADLTRLGEEPALQLLQEVADKGTSVKDPSGYIRFKLKARLASMGTSLEAPTDDKTKILKRIEWLNDYGGLLKDIDYEAVSSTLAGVGFDRSMTILKELEDQRSSTQDPTAFILNSAQASKRRGSTGPQPQASRQKIAHSSPGSQATSGEAGTALEALNDFMLFLNSSPGKKNKVSLAEIAAALDALGTKRAMRILKQMKEKGLGLDDPVAYIQAAAGRHGMTRVKAEPGYEDSHDVDDVTKLTSRLNWLNDFAGLTQPIIVDEVIGALYCLGVPQSLSICRGLQERASSISDPTRYIKSAVQRANQASITGTVKEESEAEEDEEEIEEMEDSAEGVEAEAAEEPEEEEQAVEETQEPEVNADVEEEWDEIEEEPAFGWDEIDEDLEPPGPPAKVARTEATKDAAAAASAAAAAMAAKRAEKRQQAPKRVVGALTGYSQVVPARATVKQVLGARGAKEDGEEQPAQSKPKSKMPVSPQEKLVQVRDYALKNGIHLDDECLKALARLPFYKTKDLVEEVVLGGRNRTGIKNPSRYLMSRVSRMSVGLGVEQGIAMELAVSLGIVLNNECLDELASIPRQESQAIMRELAKDPETKADPVEYIKREVLRCRAQVDARPFGGGR
eukprot:TRINITY_DN90379_c0_g1_i1.p1 TRINITY_DN90379_c0_g1~~TRINITY_DN90379_c0_g1_i1.p1  ORF type:complete len:1044 (+),score=286.14 TRINITY_DN90379_c0_g1_i1:31-3162(+)